MGEFPGLSGAVGGAFAALFFSSDMFDVSDGPDAASYASVEGDEGTSGRKVHERTVDGELISWGGAEKGWRQCSYLFQSRGGFGRDFPMGGGAGL